MEPQPTTHQAELLALVFPWPDNVPLPRPRFGKALPPPPVWLPEPRLEGDFASVGQPFYFCCAIDDLGLLVHVRAQTAAVDSDVCVDIESSHANHLGKSVSVTLLGENSNRWQRLTLPLDTLQAVGCRGQRRLGTLRQLSERLGNLLSMDAFLLA
jgi:hypothetical protein